jgi:multicomponent Na+:H+ antiporter subunit D
VLIALNKDRLAIEGTFKYLMLSTVATVFILSSIALFILAAGDISFAAIHRASLANPGGAVINLAIALLLCGLFIKSGVMPFHGWLPDAYSSAPSAVSVLLAGIITKISGVYVLLRLFSSVFVLSAAVKSVLMFAGAASIVIAALAAITQTDFKRMLAYSSISQIGYIVLALGCGTGLAFAGAVFHFFNHAIFKSLLFVNAASMERQTGTTDITRMEGLGSRMPCTNITSMIGFLSTAGIPPLAGFWSKLIIIMALWNAGEFTYAAVALMASVLTLAYFLYLERKVFFVRPESTAGRILEAPSGIIISEIVLSIIVVGVGLSFPFVLNTWILPLKDILH